MDKSAVEVEKPKEGLDLFYAGWGWPVSYSLHLDWVHPYVSAVSEKTLLLGCRSSLGYREKRGTMVCGEVPVSRL